MDTNASRYHKATNPVKYLNSIPSHLIISYVRGDLPLIQLMISKFKSIIVMTRVRPQYLKLIILCTPLLDRSQSSFTSGDWLTKLSCYFIPTGIGIKELLHLP